MKFSTPLVKGYLIQRYKRFLADVELENGDRVTAHCANSGSMLGLKEPGTPVYLSRSSSGKLGYRWELLEFDDQLVGINTAHPNRIVEEALNARLIVPLQHYQTIRHEVKYGTNSRVDFLLEQDGYPDCYLEIKNAHLKRASYAEFPDAVTQRGAKHLCELSKVIQQGHRAVILYLVQRMDCDSFKLAADIDPTYAETSKKAHEVGVEQLCYTCEITLEGITLGKPLEIIT